MSRIRRVAVLTSGGDSPGYNACVRAVVRSALHQGWECWGVKSGFAGLIHGELEPLSSRSVSHIIDRGGTILGSSRSDAFETPRGLRDALRHLHEEGIDALVVIGGDGSQRGAHALNEAGFPTVGIPGTIENDVIGTDVAIGVDTAVNTGLDALDRIKDTASSQEQAFLVEVMGKQSGHLALMTGIAGGAEMVCIPEVPYTMESVAEEVASAYIRGKRHCIIVVASGARPPAGEIAEFLNARREEAGFAVRLSILGHIQRGGTPSAFDRLLATRLGYAAVQALVDGTSGVLIGWVDDVIKTTPLAEVAASTRGIDPAYYELAFSLSR